MANRKTETPLLIIGAALPRTGTSSTRLALERLGYEVLHASTASKAVRDLWNRLAVADFEQKLGERKHVLDLLVQQMSQEGYTATLDQPSCFLYHDFMKYYPNAKVLNTLRRSPRVWAQSMVETAFALDVLYYQPPFKYSPEIVTNPFGRWAKEQLGIRLEEVHRRGVETSDDALERQSSVSYETAERAYRSYQNKVLSTVPENKLVQFSVSQGWKPLCDNFLSPSTSPSSSTRASFPTGEAFPHDNTKETGFLAMWCFQAKVRIRLYALHPWLDQPWLVHAAALAWQVRNIVSKHHTRWPVVVRILLGVFVALLATLIAKKLQ